ncbi:MAG: hypothetical protein ACPIOQ_82605, partial [Promethearchaeia archaeon]
MGKDAEVGGAAADDEEIFLALAPGGMGRPARRSSASKPTAGGGESTTSHDGSDAQKLQHIASLTKELSALLDNEQTDALLELDTLAAQMKPQERDLLMRVGQHSKWLGRGRQTGAPASPFVLPLPQRLPIPQPHPSDRRRYPLHLQQAYPPTRGSQSGLDEAPEDGIDDDDDSEEGSDLGAMHMPLSCPSNGAPRRVPSLPSAAQPTLRSSNSMHRGSTFGHSFSSFGPENEADAQAALALDCSTLSRQQSSQPSRQSSSLRPPPTLTERKPSSRRTSTVPNRRPSHTPSHTLLQHAGSSNISFSEF